MFQALHLQAIILAAGLSTRMGTTNKLLLPYRGHTILEEVLYQLQAAGMEKIIVVTGHEREEVRQRLQFFDVLEVFNPDFAEGQGSSIRSGVKAVSDNVDGFMIGLGDMPALKKEHYQRLLTEYSRHLEERERPILRPFQGTQPGHPVFFHPSYRQAILDSTETEGAQLLIRKNLDHLIRYETTDPAYFLDIDTREEYLRL